MRTVIGIDIGGSTTKIVGIRTDGENIELIEPIFVRATDAITSVYGAFGKFTAENNIMLEDIEKNGNFVLSSVCADFASIEKYYCLIVYLEAPKEMRLDRIRKRSIDRFGERVLPSGDLYESEENFFAFAAKRTPQKIEKWIAGLTCRVIRFDSQKSVSQLVADTLKILEIHQTNLHKTLDKRQTT